MLSIFVVCVDLPAPSPLSSFLTVRLQNVTHSVKGIAKSQRKVSLPQEKQITGDLTASHMGLFKMQKEE